MTRVPSQNKVYAGIRAPQFLHRWKWICNISRRYLASFFVSAFSFQTLGSCLNMLFLCWNWEACRLVLLVYKTFTNLLHMDEVSMTKLSNSISSPFMQLLCLARRVQEGSGPRKLLSSVYLSWCQQQQQRWPWSWTSRTRPALPCCAVHTQTRKIILLST